MRKLPLILALAFAPSLALAATRTVTTVDNDNTDPGQLSLKQAVAALQDGDTIAFAIPGAGPHIIRTPATGYLITANNVTIDGYTQTGATPNSNGILAANNAVLQIVIDSSVGPGGSYNIGANISTPGFDDTESGVFVIHNGDNFKARGLSFLTRHAAGNNTDPVIYCFAFVDDAQNAHISGNWFGVHPDGSSVSGGRASVASFNGNNGTYASGLIVGTNGDGQNDRGEFNVHIDQEITIHLRTPNVRVSGNFVNVLPNGTDILVIEETQSREFIENGYGLNMLIGTNGDGIADEDERNIIGAIRYDTAVEFWRQDAQGVVFAGNWIGMAAVGNQTSTIGATLFAIRKLSSARIGTNGDGVSDDIEVNRIYGLSNSRMINWHGSNENPGGTGTEAAKLVIRGNEIINCGFRNIPTEGFPGTLSIAEYYQFALADGVNATVFAPTVVNTGTQLTGVLPTRNLTEYPFAFVDFYAVDPAAYGAGRLVPGRKLATIMDNGGTDLDSDNHEYTVDISALGMTTRATVIAAVTYSKDNNRTEVQRALTSPFSAAVGAGVPTVTIPPGGGAPGPYPTTSVTAANWSVTGGTTYDSTVAVELLGQGPIAWAMTKYNRADLAVKLSPFDPVAALGNLNQGPIDFSNSDSTTPQGRSWSPSSEVGILIPSVRVVGAINYNDGQPAFYGTAAAGGFSSGNGYDMISGNFGAGGPDVQTGKAGSVTEGNVSVSTTWFPYDLGFTGGVIGYDPLSVEGALWAGGHSPDLSSATIMAWGGEGFGTLTIPGKSSNDGMLFTTSANGSSDVNIVSAAPNGGGGWLVAVREDSATDSSVLAAAGQNQFAFVYIPYNAINLVGGLIDGDNGAKLGGSDNFTVARVSTGRYEITIPGKTGSTGALILQNADTLTANPALADNNFLAYEYNGTSGKFIVEARHTVAGDTAVLEDTDFAFAYIDFTNPVRITAAPVADIELSITTTGNNVTLSWTGSAPRYLIKKTLVLTDTPDWFPVMTTTANTETLPNDGMAGYYVVQAITDAGFADVKPMTAWLTPEAERPAITGSTASGFGTVSLQGNTLNYLVTYKGFRSVPSNAHIHGTATSDSTTVGAGVLVGITVPTTTEGFVRGTINLTDPQRDIILAGRSYLNIHSAQATGGEIRGMIMHRKYNAALTGAGAGTGNALITIVGNELHYDVSWTGLSSLASNAHIHGPVTAPGGTASPLPGAAFPEFTGGVRRAATDRITGVLTLTAAQASTTHGAIVDGKAYVNIHTETNPGGEIRGDLVRVP